ncbi:FKBP-type peptidyl-prolyl cis-trans isomerase [Luteimonas panaciterrae]|uniref:FKBP-type peptidyl-prolyl cis-trans isomerase n=1 Tax=Luteimonas panaciterrae TaxID=363885 RepID=UPI001CFB5F86|nr:peptidylprolyl isomerase [Luteimonas panaciterrae]
MEIADRRVATVHFTLTDEQGQQIITTRGHDPLVYLHGTGKIVPGLEEALTGKQPGDRFKVTVPPELGFGPRHDALVQTLPLSMLGENASVPQVGKKLLAQTASGPLNVVVTAVAGDQITVDGNNPLAGRTFHAELEVVDVRVATPQEIQFGL